MTNTRALVYHSLQEYVAEPTKHEACKVLTYRAKNSNPVISRYLKIKIP